MQDFKNYVNGKSAEIHENLYKLGCEIVNSFRITTYTSYPFIYVRNKKIKYGDDMNYFSESELPELTVEEVLKLEDCFTEWAKNFIPKNIGVELLKDEVRKNAEDYNVNIFGNMTSKAFKKKVKTWCKNNGYEFEDRILKDVFLSNSNNDPMFFKSKRLKKVMEFIRFTKNNNN